MNSIANSIIFALFFGYANCLGPPDIARPVGLTGIGNAGGFQGLTTDCNSQVRKYDFSEGKENLDQDNSLVFILPLLTSYSKLPTVFGHPDGMGSLVAENYVVTLASVVRKHYPCQHVVAVAPNNILPDFDINTNIYPIERTIVHEMYEPCTSKSQQCIERNQVFNIALIKTFTYIPEKQAQPACLRTRYLNLLPKYGSLHGNLYASGVTTGSLRNFLDPSQTHEYSWLIVCSARGMNATDSTICYHNLGECKQDPSLIQWAGSPVHSIDRVSGKKLLIGIANVVPDCPNNAIYVSVPRHGYWIIMNTQGIISHGKRVCWL